MARRAESNLNPESKAYSELLSESECRAYEMVSPADKGGFNAYDRQLSEVTQGVGSSGIPVSPNGEGAGFLSGGLFGAPESWQFTVGAYNHPYLSRRGGSGWGTGSLYPPASLIEKPEPSGISADFGPELVGPQVNCGMSSTGGFDCVRSGEGEATNAGPYAGVEGETVSLGRGEFYLGASSNLSKVVAQPYRMSLLKEDHFLAEDRVHSLSGRHTGLYEISGLSTGKPELHLINVVGGQEVGEVEGEEKEGAQLGGTLSRYHAISQSGNVIFFSALSPGEGRETLYARVRGGEPEPISASECANLCAHETSEEASCDEGAEVTTISGSHLERALEPACFVGASADGSKAFFIDQQELLPEDTGSSRELYEYEFARKKLKILSHGTEPGVQGVLQVSSDGSHVYFVAKGKLTSEKNTFNEEAQTGSSNLYAVDTESGAIKFIARLSVAQAFSTSQPKITDEGLWYGGKSVETQADPLDQATPDGHDLVFSTYAWIDHSDENGCAASERPPIQVPGEQLSCSAQAAYRYDFETGQLTWISHGAEKFSPKNEDASAQIAPVPNFSFGAYPTVDDWNRAVSGCAGEGAVEACGNEHEHDGEYVVFTTAQALQGDDRNGTPDVYVWHCAGECKEAQTEGQVSMISDGQAGNHVDQGQYGGTGWPAMSASGSNIFFFTSTALVGQDTDQLEDLYDARIGGGFARPTPATTCSGENCQGPLTPEPLFANPGSALFTGGQNVEPPPVLASTVAAPVAHAVVKKAVKPVKHKVHAKPRKRRGRRK